MRLRKLTKIVEQLSENASVGPVSAHVVDAPNIVLPPESLAAPVVVDSLPILSGLYQLALLIEWTAPDQGDGSPPLISIHLGGVEYLLKITGTGDPVAMYQGDLGFQRIVSNDIMYVTEDGDLTVSLSVENSASAPPVEGPQVTIDRVIVSLIG